ncbi:MAG: penicillin acylase family protein [Deltaproteobacteria bacterium]|nr:penicillin acylase family protein [Deltaproteobacteria bacterium]
MHAHTRLSFALAALLATGCPAADDDDSAAPTEERAYSAQVRWTSWGVPHIVADDWGSLAFGMAHAHARDHACTLADQMMRVKSEQARWFGRGPNDAHVDSDFGWLGLGVMEQAEAGFSTLEPEVAEALRGYSAGFNAYLAEVGAGGLPSPCRGAEWVQPFDHIDLLAYYLSLGLRGSGGNFLGAVAQASPPDGSRAPRYSNDLSDPEAVAAFEQMMAPIRDPQWGSNGWGIGADDSASGGGLLLSNTHFPYEGELRWWESHLTIPGSINVYGASLVGVTAINIGFNEDIAWTHTVSGTPRFTAYMLDLEPGDPTRYLVGDDYVDMETREYTITVPGFGGDLTEETRTLYRSQYGPVINAPIVGWTEQVAFTFRDANDNNLAMLPTWFGMNKATDLDSFSAAHRDQNGIPWVHTMYADAAGRSWYTDSASAPNLSSAAWDGYDAFVEDNTFASLFADNGAILLPGGDPTYEWVEEPGAREPGLVPFSNAPSLERTDYVSNANNNHWLTNSQQPLVGLDPIFGAEGTSRSPRTRMNLMYLDNVGGSAGEDGQWTLAELEEAAMGSRTSIAELISGQVAARCNALDGSVLAAYPVDSTTVDLTDTCSALATWDGRYALDSVGPPVWREFIGGGDFVRDDVWGDAGGLFAVPFDPNDPVATPNTLAAAPAEGPDPILDALARATKRLTDTGISITAPLGEVQFQQKGDQRHPVIGGREIEGAIAISDFTSASGGPALPRMPQPEVVNATTDLTVDGYAINRGNSFILVTQFVDGAPQSRAVMTYSQSQDADRDSFADQSAEVYGLGTMRDVAFTEEEIAADPNLVVEDLAWP